MGVGVGVGVGAGAAATVTAELVSIFDPPGPVAVTSRARLPALPGVTVDAVPIDVPDRSQRRVLPVVLLEMPSFAVKSVEPAVPEPGLIEGWTVNTGAGVGVGVGEGVGVPACSSA